MKKEVLITGGAGYIGTTLIPELLVKGYNVTVYDSLSYEGDILIPYFANPNFKFIKGDILEKDKLQKAVEGKDVIIHLAALVGYAACERNHNMTQLVNCDATDSLVEMLTPDQLLLFGSTGSNYGKVTNGICTEETPLNPTSLYAETKTYAEEKAMSHGNTIAYRFATAFGSSPRLRLDLLINELTYLAVTQGYIMIYQPEFMRTFIHVRDLVKSFVFGIEKIYNYMQDKNVRYRKSSIDDEDEESIIENSKIEESDRVKNIKKWCKIGCQYVLFGSGILSFQYLFFEYVVFEYKPLSIEEIKYHAYCYLINE